MCIAYLRFQPGAAYPFIVAANRDEFHARPAQVAHYWADQPEILAGRDLEAGGTWLGINPRQQRFALVTNYREPQQGQPPAAISRGRLVQDFLTGNQSVSRYLETIQAQHSAYAGFNLLVGQYLAQAEATLGYYSNRSPEGPQLLPPGDYVLSNHLLNSPWPKTTKLAQHMDQALQTRSEPKAESLLAALHDTAPAPEDEQPDTGLSPELEKRLSSIFIVSPDYGTRCSTVLWAQADGAGVMVEQSFDTQGQATDRIDWPLAFGTVSV